MKSVCRGITFILTAFFIESLIRNTNQDFMFSELLLCIFISITAGIGWND